jgi:hypothetical protein
MTDSPQPPKIPWQVGSVRITAFSTEQTDLRSVDWWSTVAGAPSEMKNIQTAIGQMIEQGTIGDRHLRLQVQVGRIDWILIPKDEPQSENFPLLGDFEKVSVQFRQLMSGWLAYPPRINRLAFGAVLYVPKPCVAEAAEVISKVLPYVNIQWSEVRDFVFQVNRPRPCVTYSEVREINRLNKWQTVVLKKMIAILPTETSGLSGPVTTSEQVAAYWEVDINTAPFTDSRKEIPRELALPLIDELIQNGTTMLKGDAL